MSDEVIKNSIKTRLMWKSGLVRDVDWLTYGIGGQRDSKMLRADTIYVVIDKNDINLPIIREDAIQYVKPIIGVIIIDMGDVVEIIRMNDE